MSACPTGLRRPTQSKGVTETTTGSFGPSTRDDILQEKLWSISKVLEGKTGELGICTQLKLEQLPYGCEASSAFSFIRKHSANIRAQGPS